MPELPEVETVRRHLESRGVRDDRIVATWIGWARTVYERPDVVRRAVKGRTIAEINRIGKLLVLRLDDGEPVSIHLRMSGRIVFSDSPPERTGHVRFALHLARTGWLCLRDPRKFGRVACGNDARARVATLGIDPLDAAFTADRFGEAVRQRRRLVKPLLLDQRIIAGLGNIYTDEALWRAAVHPKRRSDTLTPVESDRLHGAIASVLNQGIANGGTALGAGASNFRVVDSAMPRNQDHLSVFQRTGEPCPRCGTSIQRTIVGQRATHICPRCQGERDHAT